MHTNMGGGGPRKKKDAAAAEQPAAQPQPAQPPRQDPRYTAFLGYFCHRFRCALHEEDDMKEVEELELLAESKGLAVGAFGLFKKAKTV